MIVGMNKAALGRPTQHIQAQVEKASGAPIRSHGPSGVGTMFSKAGLAISNPKRGSVKMSSHGIYSGGRGLEIRADVTSAFDQVRQRDPFRKRTEEEIFTGGNLGRNRYVGPEVRSNIIPRASAGNTFKFMEGSENKLEGSVRQVQEKNKVERPGAAKEKIELEESPNFEEWKVTYEKQFKDEKTWINFMDEAFSGFESEDSDGSVGLLDPIILQ